MAYTIEFDDKAVRAAIDRLIRSTGNLRPAMQDIGEQLVESTRDRGRRGVAPDGSAWAPNRPSTLARKSGSQPLVGESKRLLREIVSRATATDVEVGSALEYSAVMQFGARKGQFGQSSRGPIPWGDIPAREFIGVSDADRDAILDILREHLLPDPR